MTIAPPLREVAELKIDQFNLLKEEFKSRYGIGRPEPTRTSLFDRVAALIKNIKQFDSYLEDNDDLSVIAHCVENASDSSFSYEKLVSLEKQILDKLHRQLSRYETTSLHFDLMKEVIASDQPGRPPSRDLHALSLEDDFEIVGDGLDHLWEKFEVEAFTARDIDVEALEAYLTGVMDGNLDELRDEMRWYGDEVLAGESEIEEDELEWCIMDLLKNDLLSDDKRKTLEGYVQNQIAIKELLGVLNMRSVRQWNWKRTANGVPVTTRKDTEGQYHIVIDEDVVDMLYLHCVAIGWAQKLKSCFAIYFRSVDRSNKRCISSADLKEQEFFLHMMPFEPPSPPPPPPPPLEPYPGALGSPPPPPHLLPGIPIPAGLRAEPRASKKKIKKKIPMVYPEPIYFVPPPPPPPPPSFPMRRLPAPPCPNSIFNMSHGVLDSGRYYAYKQDFFMSRLPTQDGCRAKSVPAKEVQGKLINTLAAEMKLRTAFDGQPTCSVVEFHSLAKALPHSTIITVLKFLGVPEAFTDFFARYLAVDLNIGPSARGTRNRVLTRACGVPARHGLELLFTEAVMFFAELAVIKQVGLPMYRLGSTCYFVGTDEQNEAVLQELAIFSRHTKLDFDDVSVQPERLHIGFLELSGDHPTIKQSEVEAYAHHVKKQLSVQTTVYDWVRIWNSTMGTYAAHLFGPLVDQFGKEHLHSVKAAYQKMFDVIFGSGSSLTIHIQSMLRVRSNFARTTPPLALEAIIYLPRAFGGLGVKNPLIPLNLSRDIPADSNAVIEQYLDVETKYYECALQNWSALTPDHISKKHAAVFPSGKDDAIAASRSPDSGPTAFMTKEALTRHREYAQFPFLSSSLLNDYHSLVPPPPPPMMQIPPLLGLYQTLLDESVDEVIASERIRNEVRESGSCKRWERLSKEDQWVLMMYGDQCLETFGGLDVWCERYVPMTALEITRGIEGELGDDMTSYSSISSIC